MPMNLKNAIFGGSVTGISDRSGAYDGSIQAWLPIKDIVQGVVVTRDSYFPSTSTPCPAWIRAPP